MAKNKVNIYDVAEKAGVGIGTVSRVLNKSNKVKEETRAKVLQVIEELNYRPNRSAQNLARQKTNAVAVILPTFVDHFFVEVLKGIQGALEKEDIDLILHKVSYCDNMIDKILDIIQSKTVDGIVAVTMGISDHQYDLLLDSEIPIVLADEKSSDFHSIYLNDVLGAEMAVDYLIQAGHQRLAFIDGEKETQAAKNRLEGLRNSLEKNNLTIAPELLKFCPFKISAGFRMMQEILKMPEKDWPTAVFAASDNQAIGVLEAMEEKGLQAPNDIAVIGYDNIELARYLKITTISQPMYQLGHLAIEVLLKAIDGEITGKYQQELDLELIKRETA
jgi:LacI family transcriptional regulator